MIVGIPLEVICGYLVVSPSLSQGFPLVYSSYSIGFWLYNIVPCPIPSNYNANKYSTPRSSKRALVASLNTPISILASFVGRNTPWADCMGHLTLSNFVSTVM
ncbi:hypothetical protein JAAARDRAFT_633884 [Jaapia argillacea MUCL 33604]|uniref:Uncharacterized protein n=1 Tax=Jaapia argillacea MUCL 33604 TaxID=933084 RepID=A0A067PYN6_9AGAM|nr:hypothetical protein JAAARDRAFT_633884 [Jaapia argillacea MUCL 33604]